MNTLEKFTLPSLIKAARDGDTENEIVTYGQIASIIHEIKPVKQIIEELFHEAEEVLGNFKLDL